MVELVVAFTMQLFSIFDILFSVFVTLCFFIMTFGVFMIIKNYQRLIVQVYHMVLLIPYGERTKRELNELLKIQL